MLRVSESSRVLGLSLMVPSLVLAANNSEATSALFLFPEGDTSFSLKLGDLLTLLGDLPTPELRISSTSICLDYPPPINYIYS